MIVGQLEIQLLANMARLQNDMDKAKRSVGNAVNTINKVLGAIGAGISVDFLLGLAQKSLEYSKSIAALSTQLGDAVEKTKEFDIASRNLSTQFGTTALKQSTAFYEILSSGITDTTQATDLLTEANRLAIGGNADLMVSVDGLTSIMKGYGGAAGTASQIADTMFTASLAGKLSIQELAEGIGKVIPLASTMGVNLEEVTAGVSALTLGGISAKESITGMRAILAAVAKPSSEAARLAKELGLGFDSASVKALGFAGFLEEVKTKTQGSADKMAILFGGVESLIPALALTGNAGKEFSSILGQMSDKTGAAEAAFNKMADAPGFKVDRLMASINSIALTLGDTLANVLAPAAEKAARFLNNFFGAAKLSEIQKQEQLIDSLSSKLERMKGINAVLPFGNFIFNKKELDALESSLENAQIDLAVLQKAQQQQATTARAATEEIQNNTGAQTENTKSVVRAAAAIDKQQKALRFQASNLKELEDKYQRVRAITDSVATEQEIYNQKLEELERLKPELGIEVHARALRQLQDENKKTVPVVRDTTDQVSELWKQTGRNIQSTLANSIFDFFNDGLKGMTRNAISAVGRIASEFAALKLAQGIGLSSMFAIPGSAMASGGTGGTGGVGVSGFDIASLGMNAASFFKSGFGATSLIGSAVSQLGSFAGSSSMAAFGGGLAGDAIGGLAAGGFSSGAASAASMGASVAAFAGPAIAIAAVDQIVRMLAGDKMLGGGVGKVLNYVPVLGPLINGLFGRGPLKQKGTTLSGSVGAEGFTSGSLQTDFIAKGGLFRSDKNDFARVDAVTGAISTDNEKLRAFAEQLGKSSKDIIGLISDTAQQTSGSLRQIAKDLSLSTSGLDTFSHQINLVSEKGKALTEEQIGQEISNITEALARQLIPQIDTLSKRGETALQAVNRLGIEFNALVEASAIALGKSLADSRALISAGTFDGRSAFLESAGGLDAFNQQIAFFSQNFLTDAERIAPVAEKLSAAMKELGLSSDITKEQFKDLVQSYGKVNGISQETLLGLLKIQDAYVQVRDATDKAAEAANLQAQALEEQTKALAAQEKAQKDAERARVAGLINEGIGNAIQSINQHIAKLLSLSESLKNTVNNIQPMGIQEAVDTLNSAVTNAKKNRFDRVGDLSQVLSAVTGANSNDFSSSFDLVRLKARAVNLLGELDQQVNRQIVSLQEAAVEMQRSRPIARFDVGGRVPKTGLAVIHKDEQILTPGQQDDIGRELKGLRAEMRSILSEIAGHAKSTAEILDNVSAGGSAFLVENPA